MKSSKTLLVGLLLSIALTSCNNSKWQDEYNKELTAAFQPIQEKYEFIKEMLEDCEIYDDCIKYDSIEEVSETDVSEIIKYLPDSLSENADWPSDVLVLHKGVNSGLGLEIGENLGQIKQAIDCCEASFSNKIGTRYKMKKQLNIFNSSVVRPISRFNYVVLLKDVIYVRPRQVEKNHSFSGGYLLDEVEVYELNNMETVDSFFMASENSEQVSVRFANFDLPSDLMAQMKNNVINELKKIIVSNQQ